MSVHGTRSTGALNSSSSSSGIPSGSAPIPSGIPSGTPVGPPAPVGPIAPVVPLPIIRGGGQHNRKVILSIQSWTFGRGVFDYLMPTFPSGLGYGAPGIIGSSRCGFSFSLYVVGGSVAVGAVLCMVRTRCKHYG